MTLLKPMVLYGIEMWALKKIEELRLAVFERKVLGKILFLTIKLKNKENYKMIKPKGGFKDRI